MAIGVALLGCTGSIGRSALRVLDRHADRFRVVALAAHRNCDALAEQVARYAPDLAVLVDDGARNGGAPAGLRTGRAALIEAATHPAADIVINAVVGAAGLEATLAALHAGRRLALANKESLVAAGPLVLDALRTGGGELVPVDSEHSAILQCLTGRAAGAERVRRLVITASGGPFRGWSGDALRTATPEQALRHPTWSMGAKITIDSATLANKALEVIEAHFLFDIGFDRIDCVVHPQSIVHSMVEFVDGSMLAQLGVPSMELPILYALTHPDRLPDDGVPAFDPIAAGRLDFEAIDPARFPTFTLGVEAGRIGGTAPAVFNAANEVAVAAFLARRLPFGGIAAVIEQVLHTHSARTVDSLESVLAADGEARARAAAAVRISC